MIWCTHIHVLAATDTNEIKSNKLNFFKKGKEITLDISLLTR